MSDMPDRAFIYIQRGSGAKCWLDAKRKRIDTPHDATEYIRADIAESLYDALKMACMQDCGWVMHAQAAIEAYRKAKGD